MQRRVIVLRQIHFQAYGFDCLVDDARFERKFVGDSLMHTDGRKRQVGFVRGLDFRQFFTVALISLYILRILEAKVDSI